MSKKRNRWQEVEQEYGLPMRAILLQLYDLHGRESQGVIAGILKISQPTLSQWIQRAGLELKTTLTLADGVPCLCAEQPADSIPSN